MSIVSKPFSNIKCDRCGDTISEEWYDDIADCEEALLYDCNWVKIGDKHYCQDCYEIDENDEIKVKDNEEND